MSFDFNLIDIPLIINLSCDLTNYLSAPTICELPILLNNSKLNLNHNSSRQQTYGVRIDQLFKITSLSLVLFSKNLTNSTRDNTQKIKAKAKMITDQIENIGWQKQHNKCTFQADKIVFVNFTFVCEVLTTHTFILYFMRKKIE